MGVSLWPVVGPTRLSSLQLVPTTSVRTKGSSACICGWKLGPTHSQSPSDLFFLGAQPSYHFYINQDINSEAIASSILPCSTVAAVPTVGSRKGDLRAQKTGRIAALQNLVQSKKVSPSTGNSFRKERLRAAARGLTTSRRCRGRKVMMIIWGGELMGRKKDRLIRICSVYGAAKALSAKNPRAPCTASRLRRLLL